MQRDEEIINQEANKQELEKSLDRNSSTDLTIKNISSIEMRTTEEKRKGVTQDRKNQRL